MTKRINIFDEIANNAGSRIRSQQWYNDQISLVKSRGLLTKNKLVQYKEMVTPKLEIGSMYLHIYDAKHKATLPYWDAFPLTLPFGWDNDTFTAFNLHYLPPEARWALLKQLMQNDQISTVRRLSKDAKMSMDYQALKGASQFGLLKPTIHKYLYTHVAPLNGGMFLKIHPSDWLLSVLLPVQDFKKQDRGFSSQRVWADSMGRKI
jgi:hypothetical protein